MYLWRHIWFLTEARYHLVRIMCLLKSYFLPFFQSHSVPICAYLGQVNCRLFRHKIFLIHMGSTGPGVAGGGGQEWPEGVGNKRVARANLKICQILPSSGWNYKKNRGKHSVLILFFLSWLDVSMATIFWKVALPKFEVFGFDDRFV